VSTNVGLYPAWQVFLKKQQPKILIFSGQGDIFFTPAGTEAYLGVLPDLPATSGSGLFGVSGKLCKDQTSLITRLSRAAAMISFEPLSSD
jgi:hypothetical protein